MSKPEPAAELCEFIHFVTWMSASVSHLTEKIAPMRDLLEEAHRLSGSRAKKHIQKYNLVSLVWGQKHEIEFNNLQEKLRAAVKLAHRDPKKNFACELTQVTDFGLVY